VVVSGYYSRRMFEMIKLKEVELGLKSLRSMTWEEYCQAGNPIGPIDWIVCAYTETADAFALDMPLASRLAKSVEAKLMVDATGSINLEDHHELADVTMFSSCKGLGGLTGAGFITFNKVLLPSVRPAARQFILDLNTYLEKKTTSPAHTLLSLDSISARFSEQRERVRQSKEQFLKMFGDVLYRPGNQPLLCTKVRDANIVLPDWMVGYEPRSIEPNCQVVCHLFDQFPSNRQPGEAYNSLSKETARRP